MLHLRQSTTFLISTLLASIALLLVLVNSWLVLANQSIRAEVSGRQQRINQALQWSRVNQELINALAAAAVRNNNTAIRDLLAQNGITYSVTPQAQQPPASAPTPAPTPAPAPAPASGARPPEPPPDKPPLKK
jgi:hypothetical protein